MNFLSPLYFYPPIFKCYSFYRNSWTYRDLLMCFLLGAIFSCLVTKWRFITANRVRENTTSLFQKRIKPILLLENNERQGGRHKFASRHWLFSFNSVKDCFFSPVGCVRWNETHTHLSAEKSHSWKTRLYYRWDLQLRICCCLFFFFSSLLNQNDFQQAGRNNLNK